jgi:beta-glucosidase
VDAFYPGQEGGNALADILFGDVNPSGRLPLTFPKKWEDTPVAKTYPGVKAFADYSEGIFMGYRHYDTYDMEPLFPFGHGLSYTQFEYSDLKVYSIKFNRPGRNHRDISVNITNTGQSFGEEVVQVYVSDLESSVEREMKALKGFQRVALNPGESKTITIRLNHDAFTFYHPDQKKWIVEPGEFEILVGSSSRDIRLKTSFNF